MSGRVNCKGGIDRAYLARVVVYAIHTVLLKNAGVALKNGYKITRGALCWAKFNCKVQLKITLV